MYKTIQEAIMTTPDTVRLLRECDAGVRMGVDSIDGVLNHVKHRKLKDTLVQNRNEHIALQDEITRRLHLIGDKGKDPNPIALQMSHMKTKMKMEQTNQVSNNQMMEII